jgi:hypothetical protein
MTSDGDAHDFVKRVIAVVHHEGDDEYCLQIELGNDHAITITCRKGEPPSVHLWRGNAEFGLLGIDGFREFVAEAFEPRQ